MCRQARMVILSQRETPSVLAGYHALAFEGPRESGLGVASCARSDRHVRHIRSYTNTWIILGEAFRHENAVAMGASVFAQLDLHYTQSVLSVSHTSNHSIATEPHGAAPVLGLEKKDATK